MSKLSPENSELASMIDELTTSADEASSIATEIKKAFADGKLSFKEIVHLLGVIGKFSVRSTRLAVEVSKLLGHA